MIDSPDGYIMLYVDGHACRQKARVHRVEKQVVVGIAIGGFGEYLSFFLTLVCTVLCTCIVHS